MKFQDWINEAIAFKCNFCGHTFKRKTIPKSMEVKCPKCKEIDVDVLGMTRKGKAKKGPRKPGIGAGR